MDKNEIKKSIAGDPAGGIPGLQDDWWTEIAPDLWNSHGSYLKEISGDEYLDVCCFLASAPIRFDHPRLRNDQFIQKIGRAAIYRPSIADFWTTELAHFVKMLRDIATPPYLHHYFFIDGGALAVENALKAAFDWKVRLNIQKGKIKGDPQEEKRPLGTKVLGFESAFHGRSGYTMSITHTNDPNKYKYFPKHDWFRVDPPVLQYDNEGNISNVEAVQQQEKKAVENLQNILKDHADDIAAILIEPIQCEGGDRHIPASFFKELRRMAAENDIILIYDEVQTGFGTTGKMWAHEHFGPDARPDIIIFAKKAQVGGIMANYDVFSRIPENVFGNDDACKSRLNSTWGGNPVDMVRCTEFLKIIEEENLLQNVQTVGAFLLKGLQNLCREFDGLIGNPRGMGMLLGFDAHEPVMKPKIWQAFRDEHLLCLVCGAKTIRFRPHLDMTLEEAEEALNRAKKGLKKLL